MEEGMELKKPKKGGMAKVRERLKEISEEAVPDEVFNDLEKAGVIKKEPKKLPSVARPIVPAVQENEL